MVESKDEKRIAIVENSLVDGLKIRGLIDALKHRYRVVRDFAGDLLKTQCRTMEKLQRSVDALKKHVGLIFWRFISRPKNVSHLGHRRKPIFHRRRRALRFPRVAPRPVDAYSPLARRIFAGNMGLIVGTGWCFR